MSASLAAWQPPPVAASEEVTSLTTGNGSGVRQGIASTSTAPTGVRTGMTEDDLVAHSRAGDKEAFGCLYHLYEGLVFRHALRVLENADDADDVRQETFVRAYQSLARFRGEASLKTYLLTICSNLCRDRLRQSRRRPERGYGLEAPEASTASGFVFATGGQGCPLAHMERAAQAETVHEALRRLPAPLREILLLRHVEELSFDEIARVLGCTRVSAPVRLFRARRQFKDVFLTLTREEGEE